MPSASNYLAQMGKSAKGSESIGSAAPGDIVMRGILQLFARYPLTNWYQSNLYAKSVDLVSQGVPRRNSRRSVER